MYEVDGKCQKCKNYGMAICSCCDMFYSEFDPIDEPKQTNADLIRSMTDEQFVELFTHLCCPYSLGGKVECNVNNKGCKTCWLDWLRQEVNE